MAQGDDVKVSATTELTAQPEPLLDLEPEAMKHVEAMMRSRAADVLRTADRIARTRRAPGISLDYVRMAEDQVLNQPTGRSAKVDLVAGALLGAGVSGCLSTFVEGSAGAAATIAALVVGAFLAGGRSLGGR